MKRIAQLPAKFLILLIRIYQVTLSPFIGKSCRYIPTCSNYGIEAIRSTASSKAAGSPLNASSLATLGAAVAMTQSRRGFPSGMEWGQILTAAA